MPPGTLGALTAIGFLTAFIIRHGVVKYLVDSSRLIEQPKKQFFIEYAMVLAAGVITIVLNNIWSSVPFVNGVVFFIGFLAFGFFISIDMSLKRERQVIDRSSGTSGSITATRRFYPLTRKFFIVAVVTNLMVMVIIILIIGKDLAWLAGTDPDQLNLMMGIITKTIFIEISLVIAVLILEVINILYSYSRNLKMLFNLETSVLDRVTNGDLSRLVPVTTRDEFGVIAVDTNKMIHGLRDRIRILSRLSVAKKVQENLLPNQTPDLPDLDVAGSILYCEEVGGDYYDYYQLPGNKIGVILTDSSGHGVGAGLHMTTIRAFLQYGVESYRGPSQLLGSVNRHLTRDSFESGRFTTAFFVEIDPIRRSMKWVRAGHEPALLFTPGSGRCEKLMGKGMALGVKADADIHEYRIENIEKETVLVIYSDGIKESRNTENRMYGEKRIIDLVEQKAILSAKDIEKSLKDDLNSFMGDLPLQDDITLVVIKFL
ncbi:MAG: SpoIIE family protein phosphatase [Desulfobacterales bacterium]|nr:SpoIIE family protein phosphatase [Desulfobacterales bacterium]